MGRPVAPGTVRRLTLGLAPGRLTQSHGKSAKAVISYLVEQVQSRPGTYGNRESSLPARGAFLGRQNGGARGSWCVMPDDAGGGPNHVYSLSARPGVEQSPVRLRVGRGRPDVLAGTAPWRDFGRRLRLRLRTGQAGKEAWSSVRPWCACNDSSCWGRHRKIINFCLVLTFWEFS